MLNTAIDFFLILLQTNAHYSFRLLSRLCMECTFLYSLAGMYQHQKFQMFTDVDLQVTHS